MVSLDELIDLKGRAAIVTGGAKGIGYGISYRLAEAGASVLIADIDGSAAEGATQNLKEQGWQAAAIKTDVSSEDDVKRMIAYCLEQFGSLDILVNNAGIYPNRLVMSMDLVDFNRVLNVNLGSVFLTTKYCGGQMIKQGHGGRIINVTSIDALHPSAAGLAHYDASKHGLWGFTKNVALELAPYNIWVNAIAPGGIATPGVQQAQKNAQLPEGADMSRLAEAFLAKIPMRRLGDADDIGRAALFLASDLSSYMTGTQVVVDGGALLS